jgi:hypothetical protein
MSGVPSFTRIDYQIRSNKNIERKLVFDALSSVRAVINFTNHKYIGFGSMWFSDFRLAHKMLALDQMISIEYSNSPRAEFNMPFCNIEVKDGDCLLVLKAFPSEDWKSPFVAWFDFDGNLNDNVVEILDLFLEKSAPDSVLLITINACILNYQNGRKNVVDSINDTSVGTVGQFLGMNNIDQRFKPTQIGAGKYKDISREDFPEFLADALLSRIEHQIVSIGRESGENPIQFIPAFNLCHKDGVEMVTVGGIIASKDNMAGWTSGLRDHLPIEPEKKKPIFQRLDLIPMTLKEKMELNACLPNPEEEFLKQAKKRGLELDDENMKKYRLYYRHFSIFVESQV